MQAAQEQEYKKLDASLWKKLIRLAKPYHGRLALTFVAMAATALMDVIFPMLNAHAIDNLIGKQQTDGWLPFALLYLLTVVAQVICIYGFIRNSTRIEVGMCYLIRKQAFRKLQELPFSFYDTTPVGFLMSRLTSDTQRVGDTVAWSLVDLCWGAFFLVFCSIQMLLLNWRLALATLLILPPLAVISWFFQQRILSSYRQVRKRNSEMTAAFNEGITGAKTTKTLVREKLNEREFNTIVQGLRASSVRSATLSALFLPIVVGMGSIATAYVLWKGGSDVLVMGMSLGMLQAFIQFTVQFFIPIRDIARTFAELQSSQAAAERVISLLETQSDLSDSDQVLARYGDQFHPKKENWEPLIGDVCFDHVSFRYKTGETVLKDFSLQVRHGETIALVGETGGGKSTIVNLLCRFYEPTDGRILIDGRDYKERSQLWLQSHLGYVLQTPFLFSGTIADNIRYGRPDADMKEVRRAAEWVGAEDFILGFANGYDEQVGEGGNRLSTGQKQLISFARAILCNPALFVLDEATSSVDTEAEIRIQHAIQKVLEGRTSFIIAHRLSTIRNADRILVIQHGEIAEQGTHSALMAKRGVYYRLYTNQFRQENEEQALQA